MTELAVSITEAFHTGVPAITDHEGTVQMIDHPESLMSYLFSEQKKSENSDFFQNTDF